MICRLAIVALMLLSLTAHAHLNHVQFAAIDEIDGALRVRYRMSADMFMTNLELDIKGGRVDASIKQLPIDQLIARYFETHLQLETSTSALSAKSVSFTFDAKNGDWITDFTFPAPIPADASIFCDAFLHNNSRTQTLARINWRGEKAVFHFRKDNERYKLGSSALTATAVVDLASTERARFVGALAKGLRSYLWLALASAAFCVLRFLIKGRERLLEYVVVIFVILALAESYVLDAADQWGFWLGSIVVVLTAQKVLFDAITAMKRRLAHA